VVKELVKKKYGIVYYYPKRKYHNFIWHTTFKSSDLLCQPWLYALFLFFFPNSALPQTTRGTVGQRKLKQELNKEERGQDILLSILINNFWRKTLQHLLHMCSVVMFHQFY
jgi:hypothetical protein